MTRDLKEKLEIFPFFTHLACSDLSIILWSMRLPTNVTGREIDRLVRRIKNRHQIESLNFLNAALGKVIGNRRGITAFAEIAGRMGNALLCLARRAAGIDTPETGKINNNFQNFIPRYLAIDFLPNFNGKNRLNSENSGISNGFNRSTKKRSWLKFKLTGFWDRFRIVALEKRPARIKNGIGLSNNHWNTTDFSQINVFSICKSQKSLPMAGV